MIVENVKYEAPEVEMIEIQTEGVLAMSVGVGDWGETDDEIIEL